MSRMSHKMSRIQIFEFTCVSKDLEYSQAEILTWANMGISKLTGPI